MDNFHYRELFGRALAANVVNIAKAGSSNRRIIRTTVDYIENNPVDLVVLGLTFYDRQEIPILAQPKPREGHWVSYNSQGFQGTFIDTTDELIDATYRMGDDYVKTRYRFDINEHYLEQLYLDLRMFAAYCQTKNVKYCIFNTCDKHHRNVDLGPGFIPFSFIGNEYMEQNGVTCMEQDLVLPQNARHHYGEDAIILVKYLVDFIND